MTAIKANGITNGSAGHTANGDSHSCAHRPHPQKTFLETVIDESSFFGKLRELYGSKVLTTQLEQLKKQGSFDAFDLKWQDIYNVRRLQGAMTRADGIPPSLFWESDIGKWIEAVSYFLAKPPKSLSDDHRKKFESALDELIDKIEAAQGDDGYLDIYFTVVDPDGRFKNLRDMHEMYNCGHLLEGALAHYNCTGSRKLLDVMIRYVDLFMKTFGHGPDQLHGYPGHPELELAMARLYEATGNAKHLAFAKYLVEARGQTTDDMNGDSYFVWEAKERRKGDEVVPHTMDRTTDLWYHQAHKPIHEQDEILGHSVRAFYLTTAAADLGGQFLEDAKRLLHDATAHKMYVTGGFGSEPRWEGFSPTPYRLPQSTDEGGCYQETCASIACMMTCERILSHGLDSDVRDTMELCLHNTVLGGASLDGKSFSYVNKLATYGDEVGVRDEWFEVCCCPPNLSRTVGMIGGYIWSGDTNEKTKVIDLRVLLYIAGTRTISLPGGQTATVRMETEMPWQGKTKLTLDGPEGWKWNISMPKPSYAEDIKASEQASYDKNGFQSFSLPAEAILSQTFDMPIRLLNSHPRSGQDTLTVSRGPIVYTAEANDNLELEKRYPHFHGLGLTQDTEMEESESQIQGFGTIRITARSGLHSMKDIDRKELYGVIDAKSAPRQWQKLDDKLVFVPWFARANRGGSAHLRTSFPRVPA